MMAVICRQLTKNAGLSAGEAQRGRQSEALKLAICMQGLFAIAKLIYFGVTPAI
jgi:hypothetical protein